MTEFSDLGTVQNKLKHSSVTKPFPLPSADPSHRRLLDRRPGRLRATQFEMVRTHYERHGSSHGARPVQARGRKDEFSPGCASSTMSGAGREQDGSGSKEKVRQPARETAIGSSVQSPRSPTQCNAPATRESRSHDREQYKQSTTTPA